jgi:two-component system C4-dicarboxylate transport sensor histidine kinase DctB
MNARRRGLLVLGLTSLAELFPARAACAWRRVTAAFSAAAASANTSAAGLALGLVLALAAGSWLTLSWWEAREYDLLARRGRDRLTLYGETLHSELDKARNIPLILSSDSEVADLLRRPVDEKLDAPRLALSRRLQLLNAMLHANVIYVLDRNGLTLSASNWDQGERSFVGQNFAFRPYYTSAMELRRGGYFALGTTSHLPGYYISVPTVENGHAIGAVVVKTSLDDLEHGWSGGGERVFVTDGYGIIFVTNNPAWRYRSWSHLDPESRRRLKASRQYIDLDPQPLKVQVHGPLTSVEGTKYVSVVQSVSDGQGWTLHILLGIGDIQTRLHELSLLATAGIALAGLTAYGLLHRAQLQARHTRELENRVAERTAELVESNRRLQCEVTERERAEAELRAKQNELVQTTKLAALGQMSAGIVHEVNQPLSAIRSYADNALTLLDRAREDVARSNLSEIVKLADRVARITKQLKQFARRGARRAVGLSGAVDAALALLAARIQQDGIRVDWQPPDPDLLVWADDVRLQQVLVNLLCNALDALGQASDRRLAVGVETGDGRVRLTVRDWGPGIAPEAVSHLFDPFFTTKTDGEGLGLGLSISEGIMRSMGGDLTAANHPQGGAIFTLLLRRVETS